MMKKVNPQNKSKDLCNDCPALCCKSLVMTIPKPRTKSDVEDLEWQVRFNNVCIYIHHTRWHLMVEGQCMYLSKDNLCTIYKARPKKCRNHNPPYCERYDTWHDVLISNPEELREYLAKEKQNKIKKKKRKINKSKGKKIIST
jgi:Fe-S-cluster containining protein